LVTPWWLHKTSFKSKVASDRNKTLSFNFHVMTRRSLAGIAADLFMNFLGDPTWFYANEINRNDYEKHGLSYH
jgi:hypothetical protein